VFSFEKFPVYLLSEELFNQFEVIQANPTVSRVIKDQLLRASSSIVLNIAEGSGKHSRLEKKNFYVISRGSVQECVAILRLMKLQKNISDSDFDKWYEDLTNVSKMLSGLINKMLE
jgi:four helix bundle protein